MERVNGSKEKRILIVEDEESNYELLQAFLRKRNLTVDWAQTGIEAIAFCTKEVYDLILLDIKMPEMSGYDAIIKMHEMNIQAPIVAQTAYARLEDQERAMELGFDDYISKPIDRKKLTDILDKYL